MAAIMIGRTAVGVFTLLATAIIVAGCNKRPAAQVSQLTNEAQAPRLTDEEIRQEILHVMGTATLAVEPGVRAWAGTRIVGK
jgi:hypothetical protein